MLTVTCCRAEPPRRKISQAVNWAGSGQAGFRRIRLGRAAEEAATGRDSTLSRMVAATSLAGTAFGILGIFSGAADAFVGMQAPDVTSPVWLNRDTPSAAEYQDLRLLQLPECGTTSKGLA
ncbi:MAG: hypothetical protein E8D45_06350 [Nitrospira sp.]|nr:MAG: hypothetical protein E8D45_06350 [Nitrospira sp.]